MKEKRSPSPSLPSEDKAEGHSQSKAFCEHPGAAFGAAFDQLPAAFVKIEIFNPKKTNGCFQK